MDKFVPNGEDITITAFFKLIGKNFTPCAGLTNFKKGMTILILTLANYLLDIVSPGGPTMFKAGREILGFGVLRWPGNAFPSLVPWTYQCAKAPHFLYYVPQNTHSPSSLKKPTPLPVQLPVQISVTSNSTVLNSRFYRSFLFRMVTQGVMGHLIKT